MDRQLKDRAPQVVGVGEIARSLQGVVGRPVIDRLDPAFVEEFERPLLVGEAGRIKERNDARQQRPGHRRRDLGEE